MKFYDYEVFRYDWMVVITDTVARTEEVVINDKDRLIEIYESNKSDIWIGYNSRHYDQYIQKAIICGFEPQEMNDWIFHQKKAGWNFSRLFFKVQFYNYDVMTGFNSLKQLEAFMGHDIRETTVPFDIDTPLTDEQIEEVVFYCRHDVRELIEVFMNRIEEFNSQMALIKEFDLPLKHISKTQTQLSAIILGASKIKTDDDAHIFLPGNLEVNKYAEVKEFFLSGGSIKGDLEIDISGVPHTFADGGLHGARKQYHEICKSDELIIMIDVDQLYPTLMIEYDLLSRAVKQPEKFKNVLDTSLRLKREGKKKERAPYKLICNKTYGAMGDKYNAMYDPRNRRLVCLYGQLFLLDLIEKLEVIPSYELSQSNTDGILVKIKEKDFDQFDDIVYEWEQRTQLNMSFDFYKKVHQKDVNNYIMVDVDDDVKSIGAYVKKQNDLDYDLPIINKAVKNYFVNGTPVEKTINDCDELREFQKVIKLTNKFQYAIYGKRKQSEKVFRLFASNDENDQQLKKVKDGSPSKIAYTPDVCFIDNTDIVGKKIPSKLDKQWYIDLANKRVKDFLGGK